MLSEHGIWQDGGNWRECIQYVVDVKVQEAIRRKKKKSVSQMSQKELKEKNFFKKGFGKLKNVFQTKEQKSSIEMKTNQNLIFNELSKFVQHFINFSLPYEEANNLLVYFCEYFQMEQSRMHLLLTELQSN